MIHHIEIDYSKRSSPGTLTIICSARDASSTRPNGFTRKKGPRSGNCAGKGDELHDTQ